MHVAGGEDVNEESDKRNEENIRTAKVIHRKREIGAQRSDLKPRPDVIEYWRARIAARHLI